MKKFQWILLALVSAAVLTGAAVRKQDLLRLTVGTPPTVGYEGDLVYDSAGDTLSIWDAILLRWVDLDKDSLCEDEPYFKDCEANYISNLVEFDDTAAGGDLDGSTATNLITEINSNTPISGELSYRVRKLGANASWEGVNIEIPISGTRAQSGIPFIWSFSYKTTANYDASTEAMSLYYFRVGTDTVAQACNGRTLGGSISNTLGVASVHQSFSCSFNLDSNTTAVRLGWVITGTGTSTWDIDIDNVYWNQNFQVPGVIVTPWETPTTCTGSVTSNVAYTCRVKRVDDMLYVTTDLTFSGATDNVGITLTIPNGLTIDTSKQASGTFSNIQEVGYGNFLDSGVIVYQLAVGYSSTTTLQLYYYTSASNVANTLTGTAPITTSSGDRISIQYAVPILQFANQSASLSTTQVDFSTAFVRGQGNAGTALTADVTNIDFTEVTDPYGAWSGSVFTAPVTGDYLFVGNSVYNAAYTGGVNLYVNGSFRDQAGHSNGNTRAKLNVIARLNAGDTASFRNGTNATLSNTTTHGLVIKGMPDFSTFGVYGLYEYTEAIVSADVTAAVAGTVYDATGASISLTPGTWNVCQSAAIFFDWVAGTSQGQACKVFIRDGSNNAVGAHTLNYHILSSNDDNTLTSTSNCVEVSPSVTTTYKMSLQCSLASSAVISFILSGGFAAAITDPDTQSKIWARRMK